MQLSGTGGPTWAKCSLVSAVPCGITTAGRTLEWGRPRVLGRSQGQFQPRLIALERRLIGHRGVLTEEILDESRQDVLDRGGRAPVLRVPGTMCHKDVVSAMDPKNCEKVKHLTIPQRLFARSATVKANEGSNERSGLADQGCGVQGGRAAERRSWRAYTLEGDRSGLRVPWREDQTRQQSGRDI